MSKEDNNFTPSAKPISLEIIVFIFLTIVSVFFLTQFLNLTPSVDNNIFFSSDDPNFQSENLISHLFVRQDSQLIISATGNIKDEKYRHKIFDFSEMIIGIPGVVSVNSLTHFGPNNLKDAIQSPLWKRIILSNDKKSSNIIVLLEKENSPKIVEQIENVMSAFNGPDFQLKAAGLPYVIELIKRNLLKDLKIFSILAFVIFGFFIFQIFPSKSVLFGTLISCLNACMWTIMITHLIHIPMGLLTANLGTIIFVMTLSHIIFLTYNWRTIRANNAHDNPTREAVRQTFPPSFWSMLTTFLGFVSLMNVPAKPLRDLGMAGAIGALVSIAVAYGVFPSFLRLLTTQMSDKGKIEKYKTKTYQFIDLEKRYIIVIIIMGFLFTAPGLLLVNSDPSLLDYFNPKSEIYQGLSYIDHNGGSSPLIIVVRREDNTKLNTGQSYDKLWKLQESLEQHRAVGSVISLPVLIAQAKDSPFGWILSREFLLSVMESEGQDNIAKSFVTRDRKYGLYMLRMLESYRTLPRVEIVEEIKEIVRTEGFHPEIIGGIYNLQGQLAKLVASSLVFGLGKLLILFGIISWIVSKSLRVALAIVGSIIIIPATVLGLFGLYRIPLDIISAPASNVAIAMGIDSMIHMVKAFRRTKSWTKVRDELWQPILTSMFVVSTGFSIFLFSAFPPTQRFGAAILVGTVLASMTALYIMPLLFDYIRIDKLWSNIRK